MLSGRLVSIVLPTKNRAAHLELLLPAIRAQVFAGNVEIVAIDSGSQDHSVSLLKSAGATVLTVDPRDFDYGLTRNQAAAHARGDVIVFVTSTMLPADRFWLATLVEAVDADPGVAGAYSRALPYPSVDILTYRDYLKADLARLNVNLDEAPGSARRHQRDLPSAAAWEHLSPEARRSLIRFSNVSAAVKASVFAQIPFQKSDFGEDMAWAKDVLHAGYQIRYAARSVVLYAHQYAHGELLRRFFDDAAANRRFVDTGFADAAVIPTITSMVLDDWRFARVGCSLSGTRLRQLEVHAVLRRTAQIVGMWLGANAARLTGGLSAFVASAAAAVRRPGASAQTDYGAIFSDAFESRQPPASGVDSQAISVEILQAWAADDGAGEIERIDRALAVIARAAGAGCGRLSGLGGDELRGELSLIGTIRRGARTSEMTTTASHAGAPFPAAETLGITVDPSFRGEPLRDPGLEAIYVALDAHEAEQAAAAFEMDARATVMTRLQEEVGVRDRIIRELQAELHEKVGLRDGMIRDLQARLAAATGHAFEKQAGIHGE